MAILLVLCGTAGLLVLAYRIDRTSTVTAASSAFIVERQHFYAAESLFVPPSLYRWSEPAASLDLPHPGRRAQVAITLAGMRDQPVALQVSAYRTRVDLMIDRLPRRYRLLLPSNPWPPSRMRLELHTSGWLDNHSADGQRWVGVLMGDIILHGDRRPPPLVLLLLSATALSIFVTLRLVGARPQLAVTLALLLMALGVIPLITLFWMVDYLVLLLSLVTISGAGILLLDHGISWLIRRAINVPTQALSFRHLAALCVITFGVRLPLVPTPDLIGDQKAFVEWGRWLLANGYRRFYDQGMDYPPLWPYALHGMTAIAMALKLHFADPLSPASALLLKLPAMLADLALVLVVYGYTSARRGPMLGFLAACIFALLPPIWIDSAWWGQVDSIPALAIVLVLLSWERADGLVSWGIYACALLFKAQAIVFAPLMVVATLRERGLRGLLRGMTVALAVALLICAPLLAAGQIAGLIAVYLSSVGRYPLVSINAYNVWHLLAVGASNYDPAHGGPRNIDDHQIWLAGLSYNAAGILFIGIFALGVCALLLRRSDQETRLMAALLLAVGFFMLPTQIHERYLFPAFPLLMLWLAHDKIARWPLLVLGATGTANLLWLIPFVPSLHRLLSPPLVSMLAATLNSGVLVWLVVHAYRSLDVAPPALHVASPGAA